MHVKKPGTAPVADAPPPAAPAPQPQAQPVQAAPPPPPPPAPVAQPVVTNTPPPAPVAQPVIVAPKTGGAVTSSTAPADLPDFLRDAVHTGEGITPGFENVGGAGLQLPMLFIAQPQTPEVLAGKLRPGDIYRSDDPEKALIPVGEPFDFSIIFHFREYIEWAERSSQMGILNRSKDIKGDLAKRAAKAFAMRGGPKETRRIGDKEVKVDVYEYHVFFIAGAGDREFYAVPMSRTALKKGNQLIGLAKKRIGCPIWMGQYEGKTVMETNAKGSWFNWEFKTSGWCAQADREFLEKTFKDSRQMYENVMLSYAATDQDLPAETAPAGGSEF